MKDGGIDDFRMSLKKWTSSGALAASEMVRSVRDNSS
jgi:hypothetical protein